MYEGGNIANIFQKHQQHIKMNWSKPHQEIKISILQTFPTKNMYIFPQECTVIVCKMLYDVIMLKWQKNIRVLMPKGESCFPQIKILDLWKYPWIFNSRVIRFYFSAHLNEQSFGRLALNMGISYFTNECAAACLGFSSALKDGLCMWKDLFLLLIFLLLWALLLACLRVNC